MLNLSTKWGKVIQWCQTPLGQAFVEAENLAIKNIISTFFGYHLLMLGAPQFKNCIKNSSINHQVWITPEFSFEQNLNTLVARHDKLPIYSDSVDLVYLAHVLEYIPNPHEVLRETFRVLMPEGHAIISAFNPWSLWGLWHFATRFIRRSPWGGHFVSKHRLTDWLILLGFDVVQEIPYFFRPPINHAALLQKCRFIEKVGRWVWPVFSGGYVIVARKKLITLTLIKPEFMEKNKEISDSIIEPVIAE